MHVKFGFTVSFPNKKVLPTGQQMQFSFCIFFCLFDSPKLMTEANFCQSFACIICFDTLWMVLFSNFVWWESSFLHSRWPTWHHIDLWKCAS